MSREGMPNPPTEVGEKIICFESLGRGPEMNLRITSSISFLITFFGGGEDGGNMGEF